MDILLDKTYTPGCKTETMKKNQVDCGHDMDIQSMSKKGTSSNNVACEGFGWLKSEIFYRRNWQEVNLSQLSMNISSDTIQKESSNR